MRIRKQLVDYLRWNRKLLPLLTSITMCSMKCLNVSSEDPRWRAFGVNEQRAGWRRGASDGLLVLLRPGCTRRRPTSSGRGGRRRSDRTMMSQGARDGDPPAPASRRPLPTFAPHPSIQHLSDPTVMMRPNALCRGAGVGVWEPDVSAGSRCLPLRHRVALIAQAGLAARCPHRRRVGSVPGHLPLPRGDGHVGLYD